MINVEPILTSTSFDGQHHIELDPYKHRYMLDGKRVVGSTTVGATYPKGEGLIRWLIKQGIEEYDNKTKLTEAANIGKIVHYYSYCDAMKITFDWKLVDESPDANVVRTCLAQFDEWHARNKEDEICFVEAVVGSPSLQVGGQIDKVVRRGDKIRVRDYKTGKKIYISALHQTVLYKLMLKEWHNIDVDELEVLKFSKDPETSVFEYALIGADYMEINGTRIEIPGLMTELEAQTVRNILTYRHNSKVESKLMKYYDPKSKKD